MVATTSFENVRQGQASEEPERRARALMPGWSIVAAGASVPIGVSIAAAVTSSLESVSERVAMTAWIVVGIVGTASVISAASILRGRRPRRIREKRVEKGPGGRSRESMTQ